MQTVHVRVNDAATGQPTPCRIRFTGPDGTYYPPLGRLSHWNWSGPWTPGIEGTVWLEEKAYAYIDGTCEIPLPAGPLQVEIAKGPEYVPSQQEIVLPPGKLALRLAVQRWVNLRQEGWYSGDLGAHCLTPHGALLEGAAEDLAVVNLLAAQVEYGTRGEFDHGPEVCVEMPNLLAFSGQRPALERPGHIVVVNTENTHPVLGRLALLNCHRIVYPLRFGGPHGREEWALADRCDQCHRKGGLVVWTNMTGFFLMAGRMGGEALADLILGKVDAVRFSLSDSEDWHALLNCGLRVPALCAHAPRTWIACLGQVRTYAHLCPGEVFTYKHWVEAVRAGRTFVTQGPLLSFNVNGQEPGAVLDVPSSARTVHVRAEARSAEDFDRLEVVVNGTVVASAPAAGEPAAAVVETDLDLPEGGWVAARCWGTSPWKLVIAHTSPVYVQLEGRPRRAEPAAVALLVGYLNRMLEWVEQHARCETDQQRERLAGIFRSARQELLKRQGEAAG